MAHKENEEIIWQAPEAHYYPKDVSWYWLTIIAATITVLISLWQKNLLFALFIIIAEIMVIFWGKEIPKTLKFKLDKNGIQIGKIKFYPYENLSGFHILEGENSELILKTKNRLHPFVKILTAREDNQKIKEFLLKRLPEIEYEESLSDGISKMIGF